jgi:hypothetical protein
MYCNVTICAKLYLILKYDICHVDLFMILNIDNIDKNDLFIHLSTYSRHGFVEK